MYTGPDVREPFEPTPARRQVAALRMPLAFLIAIPRSPLTADSDRLGRGTHSYSHIPDVFPDTAPPSQDVGRSCCRTSMILLSRAPCTEETIP